MKKIVALVLTLVLALSLSATAFAAIPLWTNNGDGVADAFEAAFNTKVDQGVVMNFHPATAPKYNKDGTCKTLGNIAYYDVATNTDFGELEVGDKFIQVSSIPADADASDYMLVKKTDENVNIGDNIKNQTAKDGVYILKTVDAVYYSYTATLFTAWSDECEKYADPDDENDYYVCDMLAAVAGNKIPAVATAEAVAADSQNVLVDGAVVTLSDAENAQITATPHNWLQSKWDDKGNITEYTCTECKTVGTVVNSPVNAPAGYKIDRLGSILIAYKPFAGTTAVEGVDDGVNSPKTFDAGIAMYVGMSLMAVTGSAVVIGKKKEF